jgi:hypothetical protein
MNLKRLIVASVALAALSPGVWADDVTDTYLTNAGFDDESSFATADVAGAKDINKMQSVSGWSAFTDAAGWVASATVPVGSTINVNGVTAPTKKMDGTVSGGVLGLAIGWGCNIGYTQSVTLSAGFYTLKYAAYNANTSATGIATNLFGFVPDEGTAIYGSETTFKSSTWTSEEIAFELTSETSGKISVGYQSLSGIGMSSAKSAKLFVDYVQLDFQSYWDVYSAQAQASIDKYDDANYAVEERKAITDILEKENPTDEDAFKVKDLIEPFETAYLKDETAATKVVKDKYKYSYESILDTDLTKWEKDDFITNTADQHWSGASEYKYYEQSGSEWGGTSWKHHAEQSVTLPEGKYAMFIAARASSDVTSTMSVKVGDADVVTVKLPTEGSTGRGIDTSGNATFADDAVYANGTGRGWRYKYIEFETTGDNQTVVISFDASVENSTHQWVSIANPLLYGTVHPNTIYLNKISSLVEELSVYEEKTLSASVWKTCSADIDTANKSTVDSEQSDLEALITSLTADIENAKASVELYDAVSAEVKKTETTLKNAYDDATGVVTKYQEEVKPVLTAISEGSFDDATDQYTAIKAARVAAVLSQTQDCANLTLALENPSFEDGAYSGWTVNRNTTGSFSEYKIVNQNPVNGTYVLNAWCNQINYINVLQYVTLPAGKYTLSASARTGVDPVSTSAMQVRTYINGAMASHSEGLTKTETFVAASSAWSLLSTTFNILDETKVEVGFYSKGKNVNGNQAGWFQLDDFQLIRLSDPDTKYTRTVSNEFGSLCLPHASSETSGIAKLYKITEITASSVTVEEQEEMALTAGAPYLFQKEDDATEITVTYVGYPAPDAVSDDYLVGSLEESTVPTGNYVLQSDEFRKVDSEDFKLAANRAYLQGAKVPAEASASALRIGFGDNTATGISAVEALTSGKAEIYDLNGRKLNALRKGINIVNGVKVLVK